MNSIHTIVTEPTLLWYNYYDGTIFHAARRIGPNRISFYCNGVTLNENTPTMAKWPRSTHNPKPSEVECYRCKRLAK